MALIELAGLLKSVFYGAKPLLSKPPVLRRSASLIEANFSEYLIRSSKQSVDVNDNVSH